MCNQELVLKYMPLAHKLAWQKSKSVPSHISSEELISAAYFGLVDAANRYNPFLGHFGGYAKIRIQGAIQDYLREISWKNQSLEQDVVQPEAEEPSDSLDFFEGITKNLTPVGKKAIVWYYLEGRSLQEIAKLLDLSKSRVCQILTESRDSIKTKWKVAA